MHTEFTLVPTVFFIFIIQLHEIKKQLLSLRVDIKLLLSALIPNGDFRDDGRCNASTKISPRLYMSFLSLLLFFYHILHACFVTQENNVGYKMVYNFCLMIIEVISTCSEIFLFVT